MQDVVVFRKFKDGEILALFPNIAWTNDGQCTSYMHIGQHGGADYSHCIAITKPATANEYSGLKRELEQRGYSLLVKQRNSKGNRV